MRLLLLTIIVCLSAWSQCWGQQANTGDLKIAGQIAITLEQEGFQNISIRKFEEGYVVAYENRVYRFDALALKKAIKLTADIAVGKAQQLVFITKRSNIPMLSTQVSLADYNNYKRGLLREEAMVPNILLSQDITAQKKGELLIKNKNSGNFKIELVLRPYFSVELGNRYLADQFIHLIDLRPKINMYLWKGAHFTYEFILPISNEFKTQAPHWGELRNRVISLSQEIRLPKSTFLNASIGVFSRDRYGGTLSLGKYFWKDRFLVTGKVGYTGHASYVRYNALLDQISKNWQVTKLDYLDYKLGLWSFFPKRNLELGISYGKVLNDKKVIRVDARQRFREFLFGLLVYKTDQGVNYGLQMGLPIFPKKYWKPKRFSVRPAKRLNYEYLGTLNLAREYQAQGMYGDFPQDLNPHFIKFQLLQGFD